MPGPHADDDYRPLPVRTKEEVNARQRRWLKRHGSLEGFLSKAEKRQQFQDRHRLTVRPLVKTRLTMNRPQPPEDLRVPGFRIEPCTLLSDWIMRTFVHEDGELSNPDHEHLRTANIAALWTNVEFEDGLMPVAGMAEIVRVNGKPWPRAERTDHLCLLHGDLPQARIWLYAPFAANCDDATFCALVEHELYHLAQRAGKDGEPMFDEENRPVLTTRNHDVEEFIGVVERYGVNAVHSNVKVMLEAAEKKPLLEAKEIQIACGTCKAGASK